MRGVDVDPQTRCGHYNGDRDIIAIKFKCCGGWFPCYECHEAVAGHKAAVWLRSEFYEAAILCGNCGHCLTINEYMNCDSQCTECEAGFNPGCSNHYHLYFEI